MRKGKIRLRLLLTTDAVGGVWTYSLDLARTLASRGVETILAVMGPGPDAQQIEAVRATRGLSLHVTDLPLDWTAENRDDVLKAAARLSALAAETGVDVVQLHTPALAAGASFPVPVLAVHHSCLATWWSAVRGNDIMPEDFRWRAELVRQGLHAADAIVAPSAAIADAVARLYDLPRRPSVVRNGRGPPARLDTCRATPQRRFVLASGRLWDEGKNIRALDRAAAQVSVPVFAAGQLQAPHGQAIELHYIRPLGSLPEPVMRRWLADATIYASTAVYEPFGLGVLEAAQADCALVLSDIPTFWELWSGAALFVPPDDATAIARALETALANDALRRHLADKARLRARHYTVEAMAAGMIEIYTQLLERQPGRHPNSAVAA